MTDKVRPSDHNQQGKKKVKEIKIFPVPLTLEEIKENIIVNTNRSSPPSQEEIFKQAFRLHSQGNILEAAKYYQSIIKQGLNDYRIFWCIFE